MKDMERPPIEEIDAKRLKVWKAEGRLNYPRRFEAQDAMDIQFLIETCYGALALVKQRLESELHTKEKP